MEVFSSDKNSDLIVNNTHSQFSVLFPPINLSPQNLENFIDSNFDTIHSATPSCSRPSVNVNYLSDDIFFGRR